MTIIKSKVFFDESMFMECSNKGILKINNIDN